MTSALPSSVVSSSSSTNRVRGLPEAGSGVTQEERGRTGSGLLGRSPWESGAGYRVVMDALAVARALPGPE